MRRVSEVNLLLGGPQGAGLETAAYVLTYALAWLGYGVVSDREYFSNIKGRHSYVHMRASSDRFPQALKYPVEVVAGMDAETVFTHYKDVGEGGAVVYDESQVGKSLDSIPSMEPTTKGRIKAELEGAGVKPVMGDLIRWLTEERGVKAVGIDFPRMLAEVGKRFSLNPRQASRYVSSIVMGAVAALIGIPPEAVSFGLRKRFGGREEIITHNEFIASEVAEAVKERYGTLLELEEPSLGAEELMVVSGNAVVAMGKVVGGLRYQSYYPITPAADESFVLESYERLSAGDEDLGSIVVLQTEDEIAAISSAIGAALTGARSATATSGPGFSLMVEALGWAGMNEVPVVITYYQRGGPSTGQPTRGSQADLLFVLSASHGEFPRIVISSGDLEEAFYDSIKALNYAEEYQLPVIHLLDKFLANTVASMPPPSLDGVRISRGRLVQPPIKDYKRFDASSPISPRAFLGTDGVVMWMTGDEHDEYGHINEDPEVRVMMYEKRMRKLEIADKEIPVEERAVLYGPERPDALIIGWGSVKGAALEAVEQLSREGIRAGFLHLRMFSPFPSDYVKEVIESVGPERAVLVEHNYLGQAGKVIAMNTGIVIRKSVVKYTGRPIYLNELVPALRKVLEEGVERVVLTYGA